MSVLEQPHGYQYEFVGSVPEDLYCKKCTLVAKRLTITNCCGEGFCHDCMLTIVNLAQYVERKTLTHLSK